MNNNWVSDIDNYKSDFLIDLVGLLEIDSVKDVTTADRNNPVGKGPRKALEFFLNLAKRDGFEVKNIDNIVGYITYGSGEKMLGMFGHVDVVPISGDWITNPFKPVIKNNKLIARGALDDKGPLMAAYYALKILKENKIKCDKEIRLIVGTDEESDWRCMDVYLSKERKPDFGFSPDAFFPVVNAEKGIMNVKLNFNLLKNEYEVNKIINFISGEKNNMVPDKATAILLIEDVSSFEESVVKYSNYHHIAYHIEVIKEKIILTFNGKSAHSMNPQSGLNSGTYLLNFLYEINLFNNEQQFLKFVTDFLHEDHDGNHLKISYHDDEMGETTICPSIFHLNQNEGNITLNIRYPKGILEDQILNNIEKIATSHKGSLFLIDSRPYHYISKDDELVKLLSKVYEEKTKTKSFPISIGGATYARLIENCVAFGALFPGRDNTMHQPNEYILIDDLLMSIEIYAESLYQLDRQY